jgi:hypothetical protein
MSKSIILLLSGLLVLLATVLLHNGYCLLSLEYCPGYGYARPHGLVVGGLIAAFALLVWSFIEIMRAMSPIVPVARGVESTAITDSDEIHGDLSWPPHL